MTRAVFVIAVLLGVASFVGFCLLTPTGRTLLLVAGAVLALLAVGTVGCLLGRGAAAVHNAIALTLGRARLQKAWRAQRDGRLAVRSA